jgi:dCTP deaminase
MGVLADWQIEEELKDKITPFSPMQRRPGVISWGVSSMGYDARIGYKFRKFTNVHCGVIDPKAFDPRNYVEENLTPPGHTWGERVNRETGQTYRYCRECDIHGVEEPMYPTCQRAPQPADHVLVPPNSLVLGETVEEFHIPRDLLCIVLGKSTYARCGILINVTPGEPEWEGHWTVEISNTTPHPAKVYCGEGIMQCIFLRSDGVTDVILKAVMQLCGQAAQQTVLGINPSARNHLARTEELLHRDLPRGACRVSYKDKKGKYQGQAGLTNPKVDDGGS